MLDGEQLEVWSGDEAWALLADAGVGRIGLSMSAMPVVFPVHYAVVDHSIIFRTGPGSKIAGAATGAVVGFDVDDYERPSSEGWSVLAVGRSEVVEDDDVTFEALASKLEPIGDGARSSLVRIRPQILSARRLASFTTTRRGWL